MTNHSWIVIANVSNWAGLGLGVLLFLATFIAFTRPYSTPLSKACAMFTFAWIGSLAIWQDSPTSVLSGAARSMAEPSYSLQAGTVAQHFFPNFHPWWVSYSNSMLILIVSADLLICLLLVVWIFARTIVRQREEAPDLETAAS